MSILGHILQMPNAVLLVYAVVHLIKRWTPIDSTVLTYVLASIVVVGVLVFERIGTLLIHER